MLRDNSESFAPEFSKILSQLDDKDEETSQVFQLQKFERIDPDVFVWMLSGAFTYIVTIVDGGSDAPQPDWLATWGGGLQAEDLKLLTSPNVDLKDGYDFIQVYRLPKNYDHTNVVA